MYGVKLLGVGKAVPKYCMTNEDMSKVVDTSDEWITSRTGISQRYLSTGESTTDLAVTAAKEALERANINASDIDLIIVATITPDYVMPSVACRVQAAIGAGHATAFDIAAAILSLISEAAALVKVTTKSLSMSTGFSSSVIILIILSTKTAVLPEPAAAATSKLHLLVSIA